MKVRNWKKPALDKIKFQYILNVIKKYFTSKDKYQHQIHNKTLKTKLTKIKYGTKYSRYSPVKNSRIFLQNSSQNFKILTNLHDSPNSRTGGSEFIEYNLLLVTRSGSIRY